MIDKYRLLVIFAIFAVNSSLIRISPLLAAEPPKRVVESGPADQVRIAAALRDTRRCQALPYRDLASGEITDRAGRFRGEPLR